MSEQRRCEECGELVMPIVVMLTVGDFYERCPLCGDIGDISGEVSL